MLTKIGTAFPRHTLWGQYEAEIISSVTDQIQGRFAEQRNLFINTTWFGPTFDNGNYQQAIDHAGQIDNVFLLATVDPLYISPPDFEQFRQLIGPVDFYKIGNFDDSAQEFNFFAPVLAKEFRPYQDDDLILRDLRYHFINYNRKPRFHRVQLVKAIIKRGLDIYGVQTLGRPDTIYDLDPSNDLYITIGQEPDAYRDSGHWFTGPDPTGIPHDVLSLHVLDLWQHHFLNIVSATMFYPWDDIFVSETQFKPILGLRPFLINGNVRTYQWLRDRGFRTFNHYWSHVDIENTDEKVTHANIMQVLEWIVSQPRSYLQDMYNHMLPDLLHNRDRFYEFAREQQHKIHHLFHDPR